MSKQFSYLTKEQLAKVYHIAKRDPRLYLMIDLLYKYGLRVSELLNLKHSDVCLTDNTIYIRRQKSGISALYQIFSDTRRLLINHRLLHPATTCEYIITSIWDKQMTRQNAYLLVHNCMLEAGLHSSLCHPHTLRHTHATHSLESNSLQMVADFLGHRSTRTTEIYAKITNPSRIKAFKNLTKNLLKAST